MERGAGIMTDEIKQRHAAAIEQYSKYCEPSGTFGQPSIKIGGQSFALHYERDEEEGHREWLGWMVCAALDNLVKMETADEITALRKERDRLRHAIEPFAKAADGRKSRHMRGAVCFGQHHLLQARAALKGDG